MKLRIEDNSIRFRITPEELERLNERARVEASTKIYSEDGESVEGEFIYALTVDSEGGPTRCLIEPSFIMLILHSDELNTLNDPKQEGIYYQRESTLPSGETHRFMAYVEKDKPVKKRKRPENWLEEK
jgi:hypothetical protein